MENPIANQESELAVNQESELAVVVDDRKIDEKDRVRGSLYGLAWGDVFGCPMEGWRYGRIKAVFGNYTSLPTQYPLHIMPPEATRKLRPLGLHSDDTQQCVALLNCLFHNDCKWNAPEWVNCLKEGITSRAFRGFGRNFSMSVQNLKKGVPYQKAASPTSGLGAGMRTGPIGALFRENEEELAISVWESSLITHGSIISSSLAFAVATAVQLLVVGNSAESVRKSLPGIVSAMEKKWLLDETWEINKENYHLVSGTLSYLFEECQQQFSDRTALRSLISSHAKPFLAENFVVAHVNQGFACLGGIHGLVMALLPDVHPQIILNEIVSLGYDTDSVAAIAGTVLGARFGISWIPMHRLLDLDRLQVYAEALITRSKKGIEDRSTFMAKEIEWTALERSFQKKHQAPRQPKPHNQRQKVKQSRLKKKMGRKLEEKVSLAPEATAVQSEEVEEEHKEESEEDIEEEIISRLGFAALVEEES